METKTYIKMCDCPEIRNQWPLPPKDDDLYAYPTSSHSENTIYVWHTRKLTPEETEKVIWLPRQDDMQKMFKEEPFVLAKTFNDEMENYITGDPSWWTMKGLWLAFYMWKKHGKIWGGKEWVTEVLEK